MCNWSRNPPPDARSCQLPAFTTISQPDKHRFCLSLFHCNWGIRLSSLHHLSEELINPFLIISDNEQSDDLLSWLFYLVTTTWPVHSSCRQGDHLPLSQEDWSVWFMPLTSHLRVYNKSRQTTPAEHKSDDYVAHHLMVTGSPWCCNFKCMCSLTRLNWY